MQSSPEKTHKLTPYSGQTKDLLFSLLDTRQPVKVATAHNAKAIVTEARLHKVKVSRRKLPCGAYNVFLP